MSEHNSQSIEVRILERSYMVGCPEEKQEELIKSAKYLDRKMREIRESGKVIGTERIAIMAALNITYEMLNQNTSDEASSDQLKRINQKLSSAIQALRQQDEDEKTNAA
ncbi:cell division protein ZapA [Oceanospirillum sediminis]|uniref:Cell division protein ZapA n=1 Tax=Oceanospirillum sediminis TaxID=2760088 RepID=A0A839IQB3_9GAMM|nr:cell division protein ZapA [Oceanospirillum sediminis]MBB1486864.1 cell division protein ZapA [Oceanospirillum sediminis]